MPRQPRKIFLETSIQIERIFASIKRLKQIRDVLADATVFTSSYVFMEFRRAVLQAVAHVLTLVRQMQSDGANVIDLSELMRKVAMGRSIRFSVRTIQRVILVLSYILSAFPTPFVESDTLIDYLELQLNWRLKGLFFEGVSEYITYTDCDLVRPDVPVGDYVQSRLSCNAKTSTCALVEFLSQHQEKLHALEGALAAAPPNEINPRTLTALKRINANVTKGLGERTCWSLGDVIIALETPDDAHIYTTDRHFDLICSVLGKQRFIEST
ncbi:MAG: hypothetical protein ACE5PV_27070 [Candidatus Poribacteria bacterium]